jgi:hypothetical protein
MKVKVKVLLTLLLSWAAADQSLITFNQAHRLTAPMARRAGDRLDVLDLASDVPEANASAEE